MKKLTSRHVIVILACLLAFAGACYLLLMDNFLHSSIAYIVHKSRELSARNHLIVLGLLPIYVAIMIFGAAVIGIYLGFTLQRLFTSLARRHKPFLNPHKLSK